MTNESQKITEVAQLPESTSSDSKRSDTTSRKIIHIDMDCFFAAVEMRDNPQWKNVPLAVGGSADRRGVIATCNYEARKYGVRSAMATATALRLCPDLILARSHFRKYKEESQRIRNIFQDYTSLIEPLSLDEAYLDVSESTLHQGSATLIAQEIRQRIFKETQLTASAGIAPNKFLAKVASEWKKPNGQFTISPSEISNFVAKLPVKNIPGVGRVTAAKMKNLGIETCLDLQKKSLKELTTLFGVWGHRLYSICRGDDHRPVKTSRLRKSLSVERTFAQDLQDLQSCIENVPRLYDEFQRRFERIRPLYKIKNLFVKIKFYDFQQTTLEKQNYNIPGESAFSALLTEAYEKHSKPVRLLGLGVRLIPTEEAKNKVSSESSLFSWSQSLNQNSILKN